MAETQRRFSTAAWAVHAFSASGAVLALLAVLAIDGHRWTEAMLWLFAALVVDGIDGTFARAARVKERAPRARRVPPASNSGRAPAMLSYYPLSTLTTPQNAAKRLRFRSRNGCRRNDC